MYSAGKRVDEYLSEKQIADEIHIPIRHNDQLRYGEKRRKQTMVHQKEQDYLGRMQELRRQEFSYRKIAKILNTMKAPTKTQRSGRKASTVMGILTANENALL